MSKMKLEELTIRDCYENVGGSYKIIKKATITFTNDLGKTQLVLNEEAIERLMKVLGEELIIHAKRVADEMNASVIENFTASSKKIIHNTEVK